MASLLNRTDRRALAYNIIAAVGAALIMNGLIYGFGWNARTEYAERASFAPPGYVIGVIWMVLFALMASARWRLNSIESIRGRKARTFVTVLLISCLVWPLYSLAIGSVLGGFLGTAWTILLAGVTVFRALAVSRPAGILVLPVFLWVVFAMSIILTEAGWI